MPRKKVNHEEEFVNAMCVVVHDCVKLEKLEWFKRQMERALGHWAEMQKERTVEAVKQAIDRLGK